MNKILPTLLLFFACFGSLANRGCNGNPQIGPAALWQPGMQFMQQVHQNCDQSHYPNYGDCFIRQMNSYGAPPDAVAFTRELERQSDGQIGYLRDFRNMGHVDIAYVEFPLRANTNQGWLLVNGSPEIVDIDNFKLLPISDLRESPDFRAIKARFPKALLFVGERAGTDYPTEKRLPDGGQRFIATYQVLNGCHACARLGQAFFAFDFNQRGKFIGAKFLRLEPLVTSDK